MRNLLLPILVLCGPLAFAQLFEHNSQSIQRAKVGSRLLKVDDQPFISFRVNAEQFTSVLYAPGLALAILHPSKKSADLPYKALLTFTNISSDTLTLENVVPFGEDSARVYITGLGDHRLSRSALFRPGYGPIGVILPDNAWELGFGILQLDSAHAVAGLARRTSWEKAEKKRFETILYPGGSVAYDLWYLPFTGGWQEGLRRMFQEHYLFDLETFDNTLFEREDLAWIRRSYAINLMMAWDKDFYNPRYGIYYLPKTLEKAQPLIGGWDVVGIWPTWPALGLDQRNQWDMFRDLPGGAAALSRITAEAHQRGTGIFLCYNPWDTGPRDDGPRDQSSTDSTFASHMSGMTDMLRATGANGVVLDTRGSSSAEIQAAGDKAKAGVIMYSEGMAIPKDMPGIISGRVHNALVYPPLLNLNKFIKPDFAIFRVAELAYEPILREYNLSLFNGHGVEINQFQPGRPEWVDEQYQHLGKVLRVLRNNSSVFNYGTYTPLLPTLIDSVYVNEWKHDTKTIYTIYNALPEGFRGDLFALPLTEGQHAVNIWTHKPVTVANGKANVSLDAFDPRYLGTNNEGTVSVVAVFPALLKVAAFDDEMNIESPPGKIRIWMNDPSYDKQPMELEGGVHKLSLLKTFGWQGGRIIVQYFEGDDLRDEVVFDLTANKPRLISKTTPTPSDSIPADMVIIPSGVYRYRADPREDEFLPYPKAPEKDTVMNPFAMDRYLVTNARFFEFLAATCYIPNDGTNFLKQWEGGKPPKGQEDFPVVYIDIDDARAYAEWRGARLPTEMEWQYAAQAGDANNLWPWGTEMDSTRTGPGKGQAFAVGQYPNGANALGIHDLVGNVWQLTNDVYFNGTNEFGILKGGSYYHPTASWWYVKGGPRPLPWRQMLLRVSPGFERSATVGFRCVRDIE